MQELLTMSQKEIERLEIIKSHEAKPLKQKELSSKLGVSERQTRRILKRYKKYGAAGLISKKRRARSNNQIPQEIKDEALSLIASKYEDFGPTLAQEKLKELDNIELSISVVRNLMISKNLWIPNPKVRKKIFQLRERKECYGMLIQFDGSYHDWFEGRAQKCCLLVFIDDATGKLMELLFVDHETTFNYFKITKNYLKHHGKPIAFYSDRHAVMSVNKKGALSGNGISQFGRAMKDLGIQLILANSPQAKGRVERVNKTLQDRLIKEMRLKNISSMEEANNYLPTFIEDFNNRFSKIAKNPSDAHKPVTETDINRALCLQETRYLSKDLMFQYANTIYLAKSTKAAYALRKTKILILEEDNGEIRAEHNGNPIGILPYSQQEYQPEPVSSKLLNQTVGDRKNYKPPKSHPWKSARRGFSTPRRDFSLV
jgi:transposase